MKYEEILTNVELLEELDGAETEEEFRGILTAHGASEEDIDRFADYLSNVPDELSEEDLENVAGGGNPILQRYICKLAYRAKHRKWFVKTTYDEDTHTIYATNRFGKNKVTEEYIY